jgi:zinc transporter ZupT
MIIAVGAVLIALLVCRHVFPEGLLAFLANKRHLNRFR